MPLDRSHITAASKIMLPTYVVLATLAGLVYTFDPLGRVAGIHTLAFQRSVMPLWIWGCLFLGLAALMVLALARHSRDGFAFALAVSAVTWFAWGCLYLVSAATDPQASILAPAFPWFVATACIASMVSLVKREGPAR